MRVHVKYVMYAHACASCESAYTPMKWRVQVKEHTLASLISMTVCIVREDSNSEISRVALAMWPGYQLMTPS